MPLSTGAGLLIGGIISALGGAVSNTVGGIFQNRANALMAKENRDFALDMWNRENEYNLPINQVKRYRDAKTTFLILLEIEFWKPSIILYKLL